MKNYSNKSFVIFALGCIIIFSGCQQIYLDPSKPALTFTEKGVSNPIIINFEGFDYCEWDDSGGIVIKLTETQQEELQNKTEKMSSDKVEVFLHGMFLYDLLVKSKKISMTRMDTDIIVYFSSKVPKICRELKAIGHNVKHVKAILD